jgi:hypothetical protein
MQVYRGFARAQTAKVNPQAGERSNLTRNDSKERLCRRQKNLRYTIQLVLWYSMYSAVCFAIALP